MNANSWLVTFCLGCIGLASSGCSSPEPSAARSAALSASPAGNLRLAKAPAGASNGVLVELFTSEGCSSCPPADRTLAELNQEGVDGTPVLGLEFHVDYWDRLGWPDPFMLRGASQRQERYRRQFKAESLYTPQAVINGQAELVGSQTDKLRSEIRRAAQQPRGTIDIQTHQGRWNVQLNGLPAGGEPRRLWLVLAEDNLHSDPSRGENQGAQLLHSGVVRSIEPIGTLPTSATHWSTQVTPPDHHLWPIGSLRAVFFVQSESGHIDAAAQSGMSSLTTPG